jgi:DNA-binding beta-propeller fold protein YncE
VKIYRRLRRTISADEPNYPSSQSTTCHIRWVTTVLVGAVLIVQLGWRTATAAPIVPLEVSSSPANGDLNPYGLINVPAGFPAGSIRTGQLLVSNFNDSANIQGKGTTIIAVDPRNGDTSRFFEGASGTPLGFSNALTVARAGFVFAGSVPTSDPKGTMAEPGALLVLNNRGKLVARLSLKDKVNGPWGMAINDQGDEAQLFVSNVLDGTITRIEVSFDHGSFALVAPPLTIAHGYRFGPDPTAVVVGPAGLAYDGDTDTLYVAAELNNEIFALNGAGKTETDLGTGDVVFSDSAHLRGPLGLIIASNGDLITANADPTTVTDTTAGPSEIVEFTKNGHFVRTFSIDSAPGSAFALHEFLGKQSIDFSYVDDSEATLTIWRLAR